MPVLLLLGLGALVGGGGVWLVSDRAKTLTNLALLGGGTYLYFKYIKK